MTTGSSQSALIYAEVTIDDQFARLRERLRIQRLTDPQDPDYRKRTRQLLEQLDEYPLGTSCLVVSFDELDLLVGAKEPRLT